MPDKKAAKKTAHGPSGTNGTCSHPYSTMHMLPDGTYVAKCGTCNLTHIGGKEIVTNFFPYAAEHKPYEPIKLNPAKLIAALQPTVVEREEPTGRKFKKD